MSIDKTKIREAIRKRIISVTGINPLTQFKEENSDFNPQGLDFWIAEYCIGGEEVMISTRHSRVSAFIIQYDLFAPLNSGTEKLDKAISAITEEFNLADPKKSSVIIPNYAINIISIKPESNAEKYWQREVLVFTLDIIKS